MRNILLSALLCLSLPVVAADYVQAAGSSLNFTGKYQGEAFVGQFPGFNTKLRFDPKQLNTARLDVTIPLASATTRNASYDSELRGAAFFNVAAFPQARFVATKFRALGGNRYAADGSLTLRGVSKPVTLNFEWAAGATTVLTGRALVPRLAFGVGAGQWADTGLIPDAIAVSTKVVLKPMPAPAR